MSEIPGDTFVCCLERGKHAETCVHRARREDATEPKTIVATACNTCGEQQNAAGYCTNKQCSRHGRRNDYLAAPRCEDAAGERVAQIAARLNAATPGPWEWRGKRLNGGPANAVGVVSHGAAWDVSKPDAEFIAHSRSDIEYLLAALSTAERERDELQAEINALRENT